MDRFMAACKAHFRDWDKVAAAVGQGVSAQQCLGRYNTLAQQHGGAAKFSEQFLAGDSEEAAAAAAAAAVEEEETRLEEAILGGTTAEEKEFPRDGDDNNENGSHDADMCAADRNDRVTDEDSELLAASVAESVMAKVGAVEPRDSTPEWQGGIFFDESGQDAVSSAMDTSEECEADGDTDSRRYSFVTWTDDMVRIDDSLDLTADLL